MAMFNSKLLVYQRVTLVLTSRYRTFIQVHRIRGFRPVMFFRRNHDIKEVTWAWAKFFEVSTKWDRLLIAKNTKNLRRNPLFGN